MRATGQLINAADPTKNDIFDGYLVEVHYLKLVGSPGERVFSEETQTFECQGADNAFGFDLPEPSQLQENQDLVFLVLTPAGDIALKHAVGLRELQSQREGIKLKVPAAGSPSKPPLVLKGRLVPRPTKGDVAGFKVPAIYRVLQRLEGEPVVLAGSQTDVTGPDGAFEFSLPNEDLLQDKTVEVEARYPDGSLASEVTLVDEQMDSEVILEVAVSSPPAITTDPTLDELKPRRIKGKVVDVLGNHRLDGKQVILWVARNESLAPVLTAETDANGNFYGDYPRGEFLRALATVAGTDNSRPETGVPVDLVPVEQDDEEVSRGRFPDFLYVPVTLTADPSVTESDCACHTTLPPRLPDQEELVAHSSSYSQDIGLNCVNFTTPNRTLEELSFTMAVRTTEPDIKGTTLSDQDQRKGYLGLIKTLPSRAQTTGTIARNEPSAPQRETASLSPIAGAGDAPLALRAMMPIARNKVLEAARTEYLLDRFKTVPGRGPLTATNSVDWDSTATFYQATTVAHGHLLHFKQIWKADGYSMGDLLYSLPLAPGQKKQVVIFDWDRSEFGRREKSTHEDEALNAYLTHNRDLIDVVNSAVHESVSGGSRSRTSGSAGGIGGALGGLAGSVFFGVAGGFSSSSGRSSSSAWQDSSRDLSGNALSQLRDSIQQAASAVRNQRSTVVQTARQTERFRVETESVANYNHCHAITIEYFEILRHYALEQKLVDVQECLFIPLLMSPFDVAKIVRWRDIIARALPATSRGFLLRVFTADPLNRGLEAAQRIFTNLRGHRLPDRHLCIRVDNQLLR